MTSAVTRLFDRVSKVYDTSLLQALVYRPAQDLALDRLREHGATRILDVGCGTGIFTTRMHDVLGAGDGRRSESGAQRGSRVIGCDLSQGMLEQARQRSAVVEWTQADVTQLPFGDGSVDAVVCTEAFHWFDQPAALGEFARVMRPDGLLLVAMINPRTSIGSRLLGGQARVLGAGTWPAQAKMRSMVTDAGFRVVKQHRVRRLASVALPTVLTEAIRSG
jgi:ubiquinone/menaquinone biosynthesis C-methylase UbiE